LTTTDEDKNNVQMGIATSVVVHAVLLFLFAWLLDLDHTAREVWKKLRATAEEPQVTLLFPEQVMQLPTPALKPKTIPQFIRTSQNEPVDEKPVKSDFISDRNTKAAAKESPYPDATKAMPSTKGIDIPTMELANRKYQDGKLANDNGGKAKPPPVKMHEPTQAPPVLPKPKEVAKASPTPMAKMMEQLDKAEAKLDTGKLPLEVRKPDDPATPQMAAPQEPLAPPVPPQPQRKPDDFSPFTETAKTKGTISNKGENAVDAEATPMGKFMSRVTSAVEKKWHLLRLQNADAVSYGVLKVRFFVNREGKPEDISFVERANNPRMEDFTLEAILKAEIPPIPKDLLPMLEKERFPVEYDIIIHD
jgi:outer membrane biosynthesis protein TonB